MSDASASSSETPPPRTTGGGFRWEPPTAAELQNLMPGYTIEKILGRGGMGAVYRGVQTNLDRPVAIKILPPGVEKEDPSFAERFKSEARLMAKLNHPAVVAVYDFGTTSAGQLYFAMEYVDGSDVSQMIAAQGKLPPEHALAITAHVCDALGAAHELGIVHRDIKPANVLLNMKGQVKVADFGLAKVEDPGQHGLTKTGYAMGTPDFVAPEALMLGTAIDGRADLYAVGVMLYQMLTGNIPRGAFKPASVLVPGLDPRFDPIILKAMQHDRAERHQSAAELRRELDVILTVPFVRNDAPVSAAIPVAQVAQAPGQRSAAQKPQPRTAGAPTRPPGSSKAGEGTRAPETPPKSKMPLFLGLGVAAAIGIGAFVMMGGKKEAKQSGPLSPLSGASSAPGASKSPQGTERTTLPPPAPPTPPKAAQTAPTSKPLPPTVSKSALSPSTEPWQDVLRDPAQLILSGGTERTTEGLLFGGKGTARISKPEPRDGAVRMIANYGGSRVQLRARETSAAGLYQIHLSHLTQEITLGRFDRASQKFTDLRKFPLPERLQLGQDYELELRVVGQTLIVKFNGAVLGTVTDSTFSVGSWSAGTMESTTTPAQVKALELLNLDASKPAAIAATAPAPSVSKSPPLPVSASSDRFPPGQWVKVFTTFEDLPESMRKPDSGVKFENGWLIGMANKHIPNIEVTNAAVRARFRGDTVKIAPTQSSLVLRHSFAPNWSSNFIMNMHPGQRVSLIRGRIGEARDKPVPGKFGEFFNVIHPMPPSQSYSMEFGLIGSRAVARVNDRVIYFGGEVAIGSGKIAASGSEQNGVRDIEVINLDGLPEAEALRLLGVDEKGNDLRALAAKQEQQKAEMAKQADAMAVIPELKALHEQFVKLQGERVTAPFEAEVAKLNAGYVGGIDREIANEKKAGHLDGVIALEAEKKLIQGVGTSLSPQTRDQDGPAPSPIPAEDDAATTEALKKLRGIYRTAYAKIEAARAENLKTLTAPLDNRLKQLEATLTQQDRIAHAKTVRDYRDGLGKAAGPPAAASDPGAANTPSTALGGPSALPKKKFPPGDDRKAAEWALDLGGTIGIRDANGDQTIQAKDSLPKRPFDLVAVNLGASERAKMRVIEYTGLLPLAGLRKLNNVTLNNLLITDDDTEILASLPELVRLQLTNAQEFTGKKLVLLKEATKLTWMNVGGNGISPEGIAQIAQFTNLTGLQLNKTYIEDKDLEPLLRLKKLNYLNLNDTKVSLEGWKQLKGLPLTELEGYFSPSSTGEWCAAMAALFPSVNKLSFSAREAVTPEDVAALAAFSELHTLILATSFMDDATLGALAGLTKLEILTLRAGTAGPTKDLTDACVDSLLPLKKLQRLRLEKIDTLTPAALTTLSKLKSLKTLEIVNCPQLDDTDIAAFQKERPDVTVTR